MVSFVLSPLIVDIAIFVVVGTLLRVIFGMRFVTPALAHVLDWVELLHYYLFKTYSLSKKGPVLLDNLFSLCPSATS